ncbi:hypothetical protein LQ764DRAFT_208912 [Zygosaccharomyces rouxii]|nr:hypothetical protein LQ764DRAFT_208912 [Zygosaccharomyces rouxii]
MTDNDSGENYYNENGSNDVQTSILEIVYGTKVHLQGLNEDAVVRALEFKVEQERTKQQFYRLENIAKSIELFKLASEMGVPANHIASIFANDNNPSPPLAEQLQQQLRQGQQEEQREQSPRSQSRPPVSYKFPPAGSNLPPKPMSFPSLNVNRAHSPAKIGANAVAVLNENVALKEEIDNRVTPCRRNDEFDNDYDSSNDNSHHSHSSRSSNNEPENNTNINTSTGGNKVFQRNFSVPGSKYSSPQIPIGATPIINLNRAEKSNQRLKQQESLQRSQQQQQQQLPPLQLQQQQGNSGSWKKLGMVGKKHRRTKSGSSFGVIDLNILESSKQPQETPKPNQQQQQQQQQQGPQSQQNTSQQPPQAPGISRSPNLNSHDEKTCSENSSRNPSP